MRTALVALLALAAFGSGSADARLRHHHGRHIRMSPLLVERGGLLPGTYPAGYDTPGYGNRSSILNGNFGGYGIGWTYEGGPGWGYR